MKRTLLSKGTLVASVLLMAGTAMAQTPAPTTNPAPTTAPADTAAFKPSGKVWGYAFGDFAYKGNSDELNRGGNNQYTNVPVNSNLFQWRRIYLGYDYAISPKFQAEFLLAAEDDFAGGVLGQSAAAVTVNTVTGTSTKVGLGNNGDVLLNNKFSPYIKLADLRWKNIFKNSDLIIGQSSTPAFAKNGSGMASEEVWGYRSIERTITDIRRTSSYDFGFALQGKFTNNGRFGYTIMVADGQGDKPENDPYKWFYGDIWGKFANNRIIVDIFQDYTKLAWGVYNKGNNGPQYRDRNMTKLFAAYVGKRFTVGVEAFQNTLMGDLQVTSADKQTYFRTTKATGLSVFAKAQITSKLNVFARFDNYDPSGNLNAVVNDKALNATSITALTAQYDPRTKEMFSTFGFDFMPMKNVHIMPNIWLNTYKSALDAGGKNPDNTKYTAFGGSGVNGTDVAYRLTFYYIYGK